jgi:alpha-ketoglutarate-dependent taurine dioxygenase
VTFSDGKYLDETAVLGAISLMEEHCVAFEWQEGDVVWVDTTKVLHLSMIVMHTAALTSPLLG